MNNNANELHIHNLKYILKNVFQWYNMPLLLALSLIEINIIGNESIPTAPKGLSDPEHISLLVELISSHIANMSLTWLVGSLFTAFLWNYLSNIKIFKGYLKYLAILAGMTLILVFYDWVNVIIIIYLLGGAIYYFYEKRKGKIDINQITHVNEQHHLIANIVLNMPWQELFLNVVSNTVGISFICLVCMFYSNIIRSLCFSLMGHPISNELSPYISFTLFIIFLIISILDFFLYPLSQYKPSMKDIFSIDANFGSSQPESIIIIHRPYGKDTVLKLEGQPEGNGTNAALGFALVIIVTIVNYLFSFIIVPLKLKKTSKIS